jgi:hypothetical protein
MNNSPLKSLTFYGMTIAFVLILFKVVTLYGETRLQASPPVAGTYRLKASESSPCLPQTSQLTIEQSGIYLLATLISNGVSIPMEGRFQGDRFQLSGRSESQNICPDPITLDVIARDKTLYGTVQGNPPISLTFQKKAIESGDSPATGH